MYTFNWNCVTWQVSFIRGKWQFRDYSHLSTEAWQPAEPILTNKSIALGFKQLLRKTLTKARACVPSGCERVFPTGHQYGERLFWDVSAKEFYDRETDLYVSGSELEKFGLPKN